MSNMVVRTNVMALNSHRSLGNVSNQQRNAAARLSSGFRINSAADDAAGLAISEGMRSQIRGMNQASRNAQDGISLIQTAEGYTNTITELMQRARVLSVQGANDTNNATQRGHIQTELNQISAEVIRIWTNSATFNGEQIFNAGGLLDGTFNLQIGPDNNQALEVVGQLGGSRTNLHANINTGGAFHTAILTNTTHANFADATAAIDISLNLVNTLRANLGAVENRLEFTIDNLGIAAENLSAAESRIRDADMAAEMMRLTQANVLQQAATAMLAQANMAPQSILQLLG